jgi:hypothetical protein
MLFYEKSAERKLCFISQTYKVLCAFLLKKEKCRFQHGRRCRHALEALLCKSGSRDTCEVEGEPGRCRKLGNGRQVLTEE